MTTSSHLQIQMIIIQNNDNIISFAKYSHFQNCALLPFCCHFHFFFQQLSSYASDDCSAARYQEPESWKISVFDFYVS